MSRPPSSRCACHTATIVPSVVCVRPGYDTCGPVDVAMLRGADQVRPPSEESETQSGKRLMGELFQTATISFFAFSSFQSAVGVLCPISGLGAGGVHVMPPSRLRAS